MGKIYSALSHQLAGALHTGIDAVEEAKVWLVSRIGSPVDEPQAVGVEVSLSQGVGLEEVRASIDDVVSAELARVDDLCGALERGEVTVY